MPHYLLTGAGFSANWGGWVASEAFEYLLGCPEVLKDSRLRDLLWRHHAAGGFEEALAELRTAYTPAFGRLWTQQDLISLQGSVGRMFDAMNFGYRSLPHFEFVNDLQHLVEQFLGRFDAIFTLNQDDLLEHFYIGPGRQRPRPMYLPAIRQFRAAQPIYLEQQVTAGWKPAQANEFVLKPNSQPYIKLHGSSNWYASDGSRMLILGAAKQSDIQQMEILKWYSSIFQEMLHVPDSRLMIIGYGFSDDHINSALKDAAAAGLRVFIIDPHGARVAFDMNPTQQNRGITSASDLENWLHPALIGASRRPLRATFGGDEIEHAKVMRFFDRP